MTKEFVNGTSADADEVNIALTNATRMGVVNYVNEVEAGNESIYNSRITYFYPVAGTDMSLFNEWNLFAGAGYAWIFSLFGTCNGEHYDNYSDASVDVTKWTTTVGTGGTATEIANVYTGINGASTDLAAVHILQASGSTTQFNLKNATYDAKALVSFYGKSYYQNGSSTKYVRLYLKDSVGTEVALYSLAASGAGTISATVKAYIEITSASTCDIHYTTNDSTITNSTDIDISGLAGTWWTLVLKAGFGSHNIGAEDLNARFYHLLRANDSSWSSATSTSGSTSLNLSPNQASWFGLENDTSGNTIQSVTNSGDYTSDVSMDMSFDAGSNYITDMGEGEIHDVSDTGSTFSWKINFPARTTVNVLDFFPQSIGFNHG